MPEVTLYQAEWCPYSHRARHMLTVHGASYRIVNTPARPEDRDDLLQATGQRGIPALVIDGTVYDDAHEIGRAIADAFPADSDNMGQHERAGAPTVIGVLSSGDIDMLEQRLEEALSEVGIELNDDALKAPDVVRAYELATNDMEAFVKAEPRVRASLPLRVVFAQHENGVSAQALLPSRMWMHFRNTELNGLAWDFQVKLVRAFNKASDESNMQATSTRTAQTH